MIKNDSNLAEKSTDSTQLFLFDRDEVVEAPTQSEARYREWDYLLWQKTGSSARVSGHFR